MSPGELKIMTVNLCIFPSGARNRPFARLILYGSLATTAMLMVVSGALCYAWASPPWQVVVPRLIGVAVLLSMLLPIVLAVPLARLAGAVIWIFNRKFDDYKKERIDLFLAFLQQRKPDVVCIQECFESWLFPSGHRESLVQGAMAAGYSYVAPSALKPGFSTWQGMNSGLLILSKIPISRCGEYRFLSQFLLEQCSIKRSALLCELEGGITVVTTHMAPAAENCGPIRWADQLINQARFGQAKELAQMIHSQVQSSKPVVIAGDLNLSLQFDATGTVQMSPEALKILQSLTESQHLAEITSMCRNERLGAPEARWESFRPTCGYTGATFEGGPAETWLTTFVGEGKPKHIVEDAVLFRGLQPIAVHEVPLHVPPARRPAPELTHLSDHWAVESRFAVSL